MSAIRPNDEQLLDLVNSTDDGPVVMVNLLKFKGGSGAASYGQYGDAVVKMIESTGGEVLWLGRAEQILIGDPTQSWDTVVLVQYPNRRAFIEMTSTKEYGEAHAHREAGLERTVVIACTPRPGLGV